MYHFDIVLKSPRVDVGWAMLDCGSVIAKVESGEGGITDAAEGGAAGLIRIEVVAET